MPFTFSHPAIVLPVYKIFKRWVSLTGLIVGSIIPDFEYFIRMKGKSIYSHTLPGLFWYDLPLGLLVCFLFHNVVRNPLFSHLPQGLNSRLSNFKRFSWNRFFRNKWATVLICILAGAFSHLLWDHFTHERGYVLQLKNFLDQDVTEITLPVPKYSTIQMLSSVIGLAVVIYALFQLPVTDKIRRPLFFRYWLSISILMVLILSLRYFVGSKNINLYEILINLISSLLISMIIISLLIRNQYYR
jgi:hypothetical protein